MTPRARIVLGEARSQQLLGEAAYLRGYVGVDRAREMGTAQSNPLGELATSIARADALSEALAATRELERRRLLEKALSEPVREKGEQGEIQLADRRGQKVLAPAQQYRRALGERRADMLIQYADAIVPELDRLDDAALAAVAESTGDRWQKFEPKVAQRVGRLEHERDAVNLAHLEQRQASGKSAAKVDAHEAMNEGGAAFEENERRAVIRGAADKHWAKLRTIEADLAKQQALKGSPRDLLADLPTVALHQAARSLMLERGHAAEPARAADPPAAAVAAGPEIGA